MRIICGFADSTGIVNHEPRSNRSIHREHLSFLIQGLFSDDVRCVALNCYLFVAKTDI